MTKEDDILSELKRIRELLETKPPPSPPKGLWNEFKGFLSEYKVMGLAVAFIMAIYLGGLVKALVDDFVMPMVSFVLPDIAWEEILAGPFRVGHFVGALITFLIVAFVIFILVKVTKRWGIK